MVVGGWPALGAEGSRVIDRRVISDAHDGWVPRRLEPAARRLGVVAPAEPRTCFQPRPRRAEVGIGAAGASPSLRARIPRDPRGTGPGIPLGEIRFSPPLAYTLKPRRMVWDRSGGGDPGGRLGRPTPLCRHGGVCASLSPQGGDGGGDRVRVVAVGVRDDPQQRASRQAAGVPPLVHDQRIQLHDEPPSTSRDASASGSGGALVLIMRLVVAPVQGTPRRRRPPPAAAHHKRRRRRAHYDWYLSDDGTRCVVRGRTPIRGRARPPSARQRAGGQDRELCGAAEGGCLGVASPELRAMIDATGAHLCHHLQRKWTDQGVVCGGHVRIARLLAEFHLSSIARLAARCPRCPALTHACLDVG